MNPQRLRWHRFSLWWVGLLAVLLVLPGLALHRVSQSIDPQLLTALAVTASVVAFVIYRHDKKRAIEGGWRIPESTLHFIEVLGGWPGALLAQRVFRHKSSKVSYQCAFWFVVATHQFAAFDFLRDWEYTRSAQRFLISLRSP